MGEFRCCPRRAARAPGEQALERRDGGPQTQTLSAAAESAFPEGARASAALGRLASEEPIGGMISR